MAKLTMYCRVGIKLGCPSFFLAFFLYCRVGIKLGCASFFPSFFLLAFLAFLLAFQLAFHQLLTSVLSVTTPLLPNVEYGRWTPGKF